MAPQPPADTALERETLEAALKALSSANRLELVELLREPKTLDEISLTPSADHAGTSPERTLTREAVRHHLGKLADVGIVRLDNRRGEDGRLRREYVLDEAQLYAVAQKLYGLAAAGTRVPLDPFKTEEAAPVEEGPWPVGPKLVQVHGARPGSVYPLAGLEVGGHRGWVLGRSPKADLSFQYDPYASAQDSELLRTGSSSFEILDLRTSTNATTINGAKMPVGGKTDISHGDVIRVGSTLLVFHER